MDKLKPCPFCGGEARLWHPKEYGITLGSVKCNSCGASTESFTDDDSAIEAWNTRSNWHTGTPQEEGLYLCASANELHKYGLAYWDGEGFCSNQTGRIIAWQKITPYKGEE